MGGLKLLKLQLWLFYVLLGRSQRQLEPVVCRGTEDWSDSSCELFNEGDDDVDPLRQEETPETRSLDSDDEDKLSTIPSQDGTHFGLLDEDEDKDEDELKTITQKRLKEDRKVKRNSGAEYVSSVGKTVGARKRRTVHACKRRKCKSIVTDAIGESLFNEYWEQGNYQKRVSYICSRAESHSTERSRRRREDSGRSKSVSFKYYFDINGIRQQVCKETFLDTLGETDSFIRHCARKKRETTSGIGPDERRGRWKPKHEMEDTLKDSIRSHINSFPAYESHYSRKQTKQKYLSAEMDVAKMHALFNDGRKKIGLKGTSYSSYRRIFKPMKIKFKEPSSDTCATCDELVAKKKVAQSAKEKDKLQEEHQFHLRKAEAAYELKSKYIKLAKSNSEVCTLVFDLEQVLPTPNVSCGKAYYLRQLSTYNLTIVEGSSGKTFNYM
ncbi:hypothetical protein ONE63_011500 [Megalurothrips usitatus]|uniref:Uncharacterized protein n=1 Tax=Megalurothrips usitatus TaxID=439358 RepID=A0AAV7X374_9NEOP|nr:hypothetical protein ONE63_011500 [Megalurothrips usitatus]